MRKTIGLAAHGLLLALEGPLRGAAKAFGRLGVRRETVLSAWGHTIGADTPDRIAALGLWKLGWIGREEAAALAALVKPGMMALDVGANIGVFTLELARLVGTNGRVDAYEPDPENFHWLERNVAANGYANVRCRRQAAAERTGPLKLYFCEEHRGDHRTYDPGDGRPSVPVEAVRLDEFYSGKRVDFVKIDVQGAELRALRGLRETLAASAGVQVLCEFCPRLLRRAGGSPEEFLAFWRGLGFSAADLGGKTLDQRRLEAMSRGSGYYNVLFKR